jgi:hypothetical protein
VNEKKLKKFRSIFPFHGALPQFLDECLTEFLELWGDRETPAETIKEAVKNVYREKY